MSPALALDIRSPANTDSLRDDWRVLASAEDRSVNFVRQTPDGGKIECRYVRRSEDYFIIYVSSHTGCRHACRFCHLTQMGQTSFTPATAKEFREQIARVLAYHDAHETPAQRLNVNFMARGDALSSDVVTGEFAAFAGYATDEASRRGMALRFNVSSIMPLDSADKDLDAAFKGWPVALYYSLYSLDPGFRRRWLPRAQNPDAAFERLCAWQAAAPDENRQVVLHWALIDGQNDSDDQLRAIVDRVAASSLRARFNLVRYNPYGPRSGSESDEARREAAMRILTPAMSIPGSRIVPRVGHDVAASCGMFV